MGREGRTRWTGAEMRSKREEEEEEEGVKVLERWMKREEEGRNLKKSERKDGKGRCSGGGMGK